MGERLRKHSGAGWLPRAHRTLRGLDGVDGDLAGAAVFGRVEGDLLALDKAAHPGALQRSRVDEDVPGAVLRLDEAEAFLVVVELHGARVHRVFLCSFGCTWAKARKSAAPNPCSSMFGEKSERAPKQGRGETARMSGQKSIVET